MRVSRIHVERLKSYGDYSNRAVRLEADLDPDDDLEAVYRELASRAETLLEISEIQAEKSWVEAEMERLKQRKEELEKLREEYYEIREELRKALSEVYWQLKKIEDLALSGQAKLSEKIIEKLAAIRRAIGFIDP